MDEKNNKSELLSQLKIDRNRTENTQSARRNLWPWGVCVIALLGIATFAFTAFPEKDSSATSTLADSTLKSSAKSTARIIAQTSEGAGENLDRNLDGDKQAQSIESSRATDSASLNASGYITARRIATVSAEILGLITEVRVEEGMAVEAGQVLARLDATVAQVNLDLARAQTQVQEALIKGRQAELDEALRIRQRVAGLSRGSFASDADITLAQANVDKAQASLAAARADSEVTRITVRQQQAFFDKHTIRAPFSGIVIGKNAQPGEIVSPSSAGGGFTRTGICTIVDMESLEVEVDVNESFIGRVYAGQKVIANLDAYPNWDIAASVIAVIPAANRAKATVRVRIGMQIKDERILPDMGVKVAFY